MLAPSLMVRSAAARTSISLRTALVFMLLTSLTVAAQQKDGNDSGGKAPSTAANPLVGIWSSKVYIQGATLYSFEQFEADGRWRTISLLQTSSSSGKPTEAWGHFTAERVSNDSFRVSIQPVSNTPLMACLPTGCPSVLPVAASSSISTFVDRNHLRETGASAIAERITQIPPELTRSVPEPFLPQPPPASGSTAKENIGIYYPLPPSPSERPCDDLQQTRICAITDGTLSRNRSTGCVVCTDDAPH